MKTSKKIYWLHFAILTIAHVAAIALPISLIWLILVLDTNWPLTVCLSCISFFMSVLGVNHVTQKDSVCCLTTLENYHLKKEGSEEVGEYIPRYYRKIRQIFRRKK